MASSHKALPANVTAWDYVRSACPAIGSEYTYSSPPESEHEFVGYFATLPARNQLTLNPSRSKPGHFNLPPGPGVTCTAFRRCNLQAALIQASCQPSSQDKACARCRRGKGLWIGCVRYIPPRKPSYLEPWIAGSVYRGFRTAWIPGLKLQGPECAVPCANCIYNGNAKGCRLPSPAEHTEHPACIMSRPITSEESVRMSKTAKS